MREVTYRGGAFFLVKNLSTYYYTSGGVMKAVDDVTLKIAKGASIGLAGESGCGKSTVALSILRLISKPGRICSGEIWFDGKDLLKLNAQEMREIRGKQISMVFQEPTTSLNPVFKVGTQIADPMIFGKAAKNKRDALEKAANLLRIVQIPNPERVLELYPHQLSVGMRQRVVIAMALGCDPRLLIADEPTSALDTVTQLQFIRLLQRLARSGLTLLLISHNLYLISELCPEIAIMYAGSILEFGNTEMVLKHPKHPYTTGLLESIPKLSMTKERLQTIKGEVPQLQPTGCIFHPRCDLADRTCRENKPHLREIAKDHLVACHLS